MGPRGVFSIAPDYIRPYGDVNKLEDLRAKESVPVSSATRVGMTQTPLTARVLLHAAKIALIQRIETTKRLRWQRPHLGCPQRLVDMM